MDKVLFYINCIPSNGGAERAIVTLANAMANDAEVIMVTSFRCDSEYTLSDSIKRIVLEDEKINNKIYRNMYRIVKLRKAINIEKPDVAISFMAEPNVRAILSSLFLKTKVIISVRNEPSKEYPGILGKIVAKTILPLADGCVFQTDSAKSWFPATLQRKSTVIPNAIQDGFFGVNREIETNSVVACGRLEPQKNYQMMINAFSKVVESIPDAKLYIYGDGSQRERLSKEISDCNLDNIVILKGKTQEVSKALSKANVFVLSSDYEGMPNALMEAMAVGVPSISTDCPCGGPKYLLSEECGILVGVGNSQQLAREIIRVLTDNNLADTLSQRAKIKAESFRPETINKEWETYIASVCNGLVGGKNV